MFRVTVDQDGKVALPPDVCRRLRLEAGEELLIEESDRGLVLHTIRPTVRKVYLEPTTRCNLSCRTCVRHVWDDPEGDMSAETFDHVLRGLQALPELREVGLGGYGEPLAAPDVLDRVEALKKLGLKVSISTNGALLDEQCAEDLVRLGVDAVIVSMDGTEPQTYAEVRQGADLPTVIEHLEGLKRIKEAHHTPLPRLDIEFVAMKRNLTELGEMPSLARRLGASRVLVSHLLPHTPEMVAETLYCRDETPPLAMPASWPVAAEGWLLQGTLDLPRMHWGATRHCRFVADEALVIGWDGGVSPCYALSHSYPYYIFGRRKQVSRYTLGNVTETPLPDIWSAEDHVRFRSAVRDFRFPSCVDCDLRDTCDLTEANEGCWGHNPSCADCLWAQDIIRCP